MRYYEYKLPNSSEWIPTLSIKGKQFPKGTRIRAVITDRDGTLLDSWTIPLNKNGKPDFKHSRGIQRGY